MEVNDPQFSWAPWTEEQVEALRKWQSSGYVHPFTSENGHHLIPTKDGWIEVEGGPVVQKWAHHFMFDSTQLAMFSQGLPWQK